jgi:uncharacterized protein with PQ loop repeat
MTDCPKPHAAANLTFGILIILGTIISFLPQYYKIIKNRSVTGISHWTQGLNNMSAFCAFFGSFMLDYYLFKCCKHGHCGNILLPMIQLLFSWVCPLINYVIYIRYFKSNNTKYSYKVYGFFSFYIVIFLVCATLTSVVLVARWSSWEKHAILFGRLLNITSVCITAFVWLPQIIDIYRNKKVGSLSLISLAIQSPGSLIVFIYQFVANKSSWYIGLPYLVTALLQAGTLVMGYIYEKKYKLYHQLPSGNLYDSDTDSTTSNDNDPNIPINPIINDTFSIHNYYTDDISVNTDTITNYDSQSID